MLGRRSQRDFEDEIRSHIELETERLLAQGLSREDAERAARLRFGNVGIAEDRFYHAQRFALGATASAVRRMVVSQGTRVALAGVVVGIAAAFASTRLLESLLFGVKPVDPILFAAMAVTMIAIASYMPARRASRVNPIESLRSD